MRAAAALLVLEMLTKPTPTHPPHTHNPIPRTLPADYDEPIVRGPARLVTLTAT